MSALRKRLQAIDRLEEIRQRNGTIRAIAAEYGMTPLEVRRELELIERQIQDYGPMSLDDQIAMLAAEFDLDPEEIRAEAVRIASRRQTGSVR